MKIKQLLESTSELAQELMQPKYKEYSQGIKRLLNNDLMRHHVSLNH